VPDLSEVRDLLRRELSEPILEQARLALGVAARRLPGLVVVAGSGSVIAATSYAGAGSSATKRTPAPSAAADSGTTAIPAPAATASSACSTDGPGASIGDGATPAARHAAITPS
jgi:hypothetical protein